MQGNVTKFIEFKYPDEVGLYQKCLSKGLEPHTNLRSDQLSETTNNALHNNHLREAGFTLLEIDSIVKLHVATKVIKRYLETRGTNLLDIFDAFKKLQPGAYSFDYLYILVDFIRWEAQAYIAQRNLRPHATSFGMGGDAQPTLNISTIASIVAAHYLQENPVFRDYVQCVVKIGTRAITADIGSSDIVQSLRGFYPEGSGYISLAEMGFNKAYTPPVIETRRKLPEYGLLDICKIIFPAANLSNAAVAVTGCSKQEYEMPMRRIAEYLNSVMVIAASKSGHDEIMLGRSSFAMKKPGKSWVVKSVEIESDDSSRRFLRARNSLNEQEQASIDILRGNADEHVLEVVGYNAALLILPYIDPADFESFGKKMTEFLISQRTAPTIVKNESFRAI